MKTMTFMRLAAAAITAAFLTVSCQEKNPSVPGGEGGETPGAPAYPQTAMTFTVNGEEIPVGKAFADPFCSRQLLMHQSILTKMQWVPMTSNIFR